MTQFKLLDGVIVTADVYNKGEVGFVHTIKRNANKSSGHVTTVYYVRFRDRKIIPYNESGLRLHRRWRWNDITPEKVVFT